MKNKGTLSATDVIFCKPKIVLKENIYEEKFALVIISMLHLKQAKGLVCGIRFHIHHQIVWC